MVSLVNSVTAQRIGKSLPPGSYLGNPNSAPGPAQVIRTGHIAAALVAGGFILPASISSQVPLAVQVATQLTWQGPASEALAAGALVSIWDDAGSAAAQNANATDGTKPAIGFAVEAVASGGQALVSFPGQIISGLATTLAPGKQCFLSTTGGGITQTAPNATGNWLQPVGYALDATTLLFLFYDGVILG